MNKYLKQLAEQFKKSKIQFLTILVFSSLVVALVLYVSQITGINVTKFTRDPASIQHFPFYIGILSNLGVLFWTSAVAICFFSAILIKEKSENSKAVKFLISSGFLTLLLTLDDFFLFHEELFPDYLSIEQSYVFLGYLLIFAIYILLNLNIILETNYLFLSVALLFLGLSASADQFLSYSTMETFYEDGLKFIGIIFWSSYFVNTSIYFIKKLHSQKNFLHK